MNVCIFGLGYVGSVSAACLANLGHNVIGVDINRLKVDLINEGRSPVVEPAVDHLIDEAVRAGRLRATTDAEESVLDSEITLVCIGTPSRRNGGLDLTGVHRAIRQIGNALEGATTFHTVVIRSTVLPGTLADLVIPELESASGKKAGRDFGVASNPEFLREGSAVADFMRPAMNLVGTDDPRTETVLRRLYAGIDAPFVPVGVREAEMVKYACNGFHALKVAFANEIGVLCKALGADSHRVMEAFCRDTKLNISASYLRPGFAFGGSCLPKDLRAVTHRARELDLAVPLLDSILPSNRRHLERLAEMVLDTKCKSVGILGLSFKSGSDDLRESPLVGLAELLIGKGLKLAIFDRDVSYARLFGANREYIEQEIPHIASLLRETPEEVVRESQLVVIGKAEPEFAALAEGLSTRIVFDVVRMNDIEAACPNYEGVCW